MNAARIALICCSVLVLGASAPKKKAKPQQPAPIHKQSFDDILKNYLFVADFAEKEPERKISNEVFWRYPLRIPKISFPIDVDLLDAPKQIPATPGEGMGAHHMNRARVFFLDGNYEEAKNVWLAGRARYKQEYPFHRRTDYFIGLAFLKLASQYLKDAGGNWQDVNVKTNFSNAATFLSWAFVRKADQQDPLVDAATPRQLYNLAAIYFLYERFPAAYAAADTGLDYLRKTGKTAYRPQFQRVMAESYIKAQNYLEAVQTIDTAIRQDPDIKQAAAMFARVGDIYFNQNNYELAEEAYAIANKLDQDVHRLNPAQFVLQGETLFWMGKFPESQKMMYFALDGAARKEAVSELPKDFAAFAQLRIADAYLARKDNEKARVEYTKVIDQFRGSEAAKIAKVRSACLELPQYEGKNVDHTRKLLEEAAKEDLSPLITEMATACEVASYAERERTPQMVERVRAFAAKYPESPLLKQFVGPIRKVQARKLDDYFAAGDKYLAIKFFEKNRKTLFPKVSEERQQELFAAYADVWRSASASEFWAAYDRVLDSDDKVLRQAVVAADMADEPRSASKWSKINTGVATKLLKRKWTAKPVQANVEFLHRVMASQSASQHIPWITNLTETWIAGDAELKCTLYYSLLTRAWANKKLNAGTRAHIEKKSLALIDGSLPDLFKSDASCAQSLLEMEQTVLASKPKELAKRYLARKDWEFSGTFTSMVWVTAEKMAEKRQTADAKDIWKMLVEKAPKDAPELVLAKARLDERRSETEEMWQQ